jgi:putative ABC transport system substrate-binding protein
LLPGAKSFARLYNASSIASVQPSIMKEDAAAARQLGVELRHLPVAQVEGIVASMFDAAARSGIEAMYVTAASLFVVNRALVARLALQHRIAVLGPDSRFADAGTVASYGENFSQRYRRAAFFVDKILRGSKPADIPVEQPTIFEFVVNLRTAGAMGMTLPRPVLLQADRVIK